MFASLRRVALIGIVVLACCARAEAAPLAHPGQPVLPGPLPSGRAFQRLASYPQTLVELDPRRASQAVPGLTLAGGEQINPQIALWRFPSGVARRLLPGLLRGGLVRSVVPDVPLRPAAAPALSFLDQFTDPLVSSEWWVPVVRANGWDPPGPGVPLTIIDSGVDLSHPEFSERPNTTALNPQTVTGNDEYHGTAVASVAAAPTNGVGLVGIYPQAKLQLWDASPKGEVTLGDEIAGIAAASKHGRGVINLSLGGQDRFSAEKDALMAAFGSGSLIVASVGNNRQAGSPALYPASFPHVLSVGATTERNRATSFSSASPALDLAAPGQDIPAAVPTYWSASGYATLNGTSFSAPLVSGAATAVWTARPKLQNTQLFDLIRFSARNVGNRSWNRDTGFGILNVAAAASRAPPSVDPQEPNEDVYLVKPNGLFRSGHASLTGPDHPHARLEARVERAKDPEDVYRAYLPAHGRLVVTVRPTANISLEVWGPRTKTVFERGAAARRDLLGVSARAGRRTERVTVRSRGTGAYVYVDVFLARKVFAAGYTMTVTSARR